MKANQRTLTVRKIEHERSPGHHSPKVPGEIQLLRMRLVTAESLLKRAKEQAHQAKRRRKLAKLLAKRARKGVKEAKVVLADARAVLGAGEGRLAFHPH